MSEQKKDTNNKNLGKLTRLLAAMDEDSLTREEFVEVVTALAAHLKKIEANITESVRTMNDGLNKKSDETSASNINKLSAVEDDIKAMMKNTFRSMNEEVMSKIKRMKDFVDSIEVFDGKDADEEKIVETVLSRINLPEMPSIEEDLPKFGDPIRNALELLQDDEKLSMDAIGGLKEALEKIERRPHLLGGGGSAFSPDSFNNFVTEDETPTGTVNGSNKVFTTNLKPSPVNSLKVYVNGQRTTITEDYTFAGQTITFIIAPPTGSIIRVDYRN